MGNDKKVQILRKGQKITFQIPLVVLRAFAYQNDAVYYIVGHRKKETPMGHQGGVLWGVLKTDGTYEQIPTEVYKRAEQLVVSENLLHGLE